jgi:predicted ATPase
LHVRIADALETHSPEVTESQPELLAQHYAEAGLIEKSVAYWGKAAQRSAARFAMAEAAAQFQKGLDQLALLPDNPDRQRQELEFSCGLAAVLQIVKGDGASETGHAYAQALELWERLGCPAEFLHVPWGKSRYHIYHGEFNLALQLADGVLHRSRQYNDSAGLVLGHYSSGHNLLLTGRFASCRSHLEEVLALYDPVAHRSLTDHAGHHPQVNAQSLLGIVLLYLGHPDQAVAQSNASIAEARRLAHPPTLAASLANSSRLLSLAGADSALNDRADELIALATDRGFPFWGMLGTLYHGWVAVKRGDAAEGISLLRGGSAAYRAAGAEIGMPYFLGLLARACEIAGQIEEAVTQLDDALQSADRTGACWFAAELNGRKGRLLLRQGHTEAAEKLYGKALTIAKEQEAKLWELRAAVSLARLLRDQGRRNEARDLLAPVYGWFTEGFDTRDLKAANALLKELDA